MGKKIVLPVVFLLLAWGFWSSPSFKEVAAGVAIFLLGMLSIEDGFESFTGGGLEKLLRNSTDAVWKSLCFGLVATALAQSSSLVSLLTITFLSAGMIDLTAGLGIIFGSNIGTTTGAWLIAGIGLKVDIAVYAMPIIVFGAILRFQSGRSLKGFGAVLVGVGFLFLGIAYTKSGFDSFAQTLDLTQYSIPGLRGLLVYTGIGIILTVIMQSSHATLILAIAAVASGQISYENSLAIAIGSNVGTTVTAIIGAMGANVAGKRLALAHMLFNVTMAVLALVFIGLLMLTVDSISSLLGIAPENYALKFAVFHSLFNVIGVAIMTPPIRYLVAFLEWVIPDTVIDSSAPRYLNEAALKLPDTALEAITNETSHLYENVVDLVCAGIGVAVEDLRSDKPLADATRASTFPPNLDMEALYQTRVKGLYGSIVEFAIKAEEAMLPDQLRQLQAIRLVARDLVIAVKDVKHLHKNMQQYLTSSNAAMAAQYSSARALIADVLRYTTKIRDNRPAAREALANLSAEVEDHDVIENGKADQLIRDGKIAPGMATSLINDTGYFQNICRCLIDAGLNVIEFRLKSTIASPSDPVSQPPAVTTPVTGIEAHAPGL